MAKQSKHQSFEDLYAKLEEHVARLEQGGLPLEEAIAVYEAGMVLARECQERLDEAEQTITKLRESFASVPHRMNGAALNEAAADDYEYVAGGDAEYEPDEDTP